MSELLVNGATTYVLDEYARWLEEERDWIPPGEQVAMFSIGCVTAVSCCRGCALIEVCSDEHYEIFHGRLSDARVSHHTHCMQCMVTYTIDGAQFIDHTDPRWEVGSVSLQAVF